MSHSIHDAHVDATRKTGFCCGNANNLLSMAKASKSHRSSKISTGAEVQNDTDGIYESQNGHDHKIEVGPECLNLLGEYVFTGQLVRDKKNSKETNEKAQVMAKLTAKELTWGSETLKVADIVSISHVLHTRRFTVHSYPWLKSRWPCRKTCRKRKDIHFLAPVPEEAAKWVVAFQSLNCFINYSPQPLPPSKRQGSIVETRDSPVYDASKCLLDRVMLVILNPRSGRGCARKIYDSKVEPILKLAGIRLTVVETDGPHHARRHAATMDLSTCANGIICVGGDGIVNEVLNGLLSREDAKSRTLAIGIIPAGSDNSLIWTVMGIRDPASAALAIVKGGLISTDVISVEWMKTGDFHMGHTVTYYGFMSDVLELSEKYQRRFGPLRYFVAGAMKFLCLRGYECEVEFLPAASQEHHEKTDGRAKRNEDTQPNFDESLDIETGARVFNGDMICSTPSRSPLDHDSHSDANFEPSEFVRALDTRSKRSLTMRVAMQNGTEEVVAVNHSVSGPTTPSPRPRSRSKSRIERGWSAGRNNGNGNSKSSWDYAVVDCSIDTAGEDFASSLGAKWAAQQEVGGLDVKANSGTNGGAHGISKHGGWHSGENEKWVVKQGPFLGVMICNHKCKTVQCLESQVMAPSAEPDDRMLDLLMVHNVGRLRLIQFLVLMQFGRHMSLPFVEYVKVHSVKLKPGNKSNIGCGIDGELMPLNGPISVTLLEDQHQLIGSSATGARE
ncbi:hypothetical protein GOP47_0030428 [Adiantum capillus-veneris]|nr:hypothetical protein GOP47_0030051 [Adiantum capillus-veneris]KAI5055283.1 hypothetical protein GOP47_0030428 [Adiantum capillus-veneris]